MPQMMSQIVFSRRLTSIAFSLMLIPVLVSIPTRSQDGGIREEQPPIAVEEIISQFASMESEFRLARGNYTYRQDVTVQELNARDRVIGEYHMISDILFEPDGLSRTEKVVFAPQSTLEGIQLTPQDLDDIRDIQPFVLTTEDLNLYDVEYLGKELIDEIDTYVFHVGPKVLEEGERYFEGQIWVDDLDLQIVKTFGKAVPDITENGQENLFPRFETYREQIDDYWFPTYTRAVDTLNFSSGPKKIRQVIRYENYKQFASDVTLTFGEEIEDEAGAGSVDSADPAPPQQ